MTNRIALFIATAALLATGMTFITFSAARARRRPTIVPQSKTSIDNELRLPTGKYGSRHGTATNLQSP